MKALIIENGNKIAKTDIPTIPSKGNKIKLTNGTSYKVNDIVFVEGLLEGEVHNVTIHLELHCEKIKGEKVMTNKEQVFFAKTNESVIIPSKEEGNAGYDIYANFEEDYIIINPHETKMIPTGLISCCDSKYYFQLFERGSTGTRGIAQRCGVIDSNFRGEWFVPLTNTTTKPLVIVKQNSIGKFKKETSFEEVIIYPYEKAICQAVLIEVPKVDVIELSVEEIKKFTTTRGEGCLGSSGK